MSVDKSALVNARVLFKKIGERLDISDGTLELYEDSVLLKPRWETRPRGSIRRDPETSGVDIPFSNIIQITGVVRGLFLRTAEIRVQTEPRVIWEIRGSPKVYSRLLAVFQAWRKERLRLGLSSGHPEPPSH
jgi:hypothetical protein